ncbi:hypothetical protein EDC01DRAFT_653982 [Geopyxis carbonaria]|nr:hypothetical protein EDC01DRAFT_653982 [Geopyxis carbonaria]
MPLEICDSEDDGEFDTSVELLAPPVPIPATNNLLHLPSSSDSPQKNVPTSGEIRCMEIEAAHAALIAPSPSIQTNIDSSKATSAPQLIMTPSVTKQPTRDIYDLSSDIDVPPVTKSKMHKRATTMPTASRQPHSDSDFEIPSNSKKVKQKKKVKTLASAKKRSKTDPIPVFDLSSGSDDNDWGPELMARLKSRATTKTNPEKETLTKQRTRRESVKDINYNIAPPLGSLADEDIQENNTTKNTDFPTPSKNFMVDLTKEELLLASQKRQEYDSITLAPPATSDDGAPPPTFLSTIPDPPDQGPISIEPPPPELTSAEFIAPSFYEGGDLEPAQKKRAKTDPGLGHGFGLNAGVASEWRAAKGKGRTNLSDIKPRTHIHSDDDFDVFEVQSDSPPKKTKKPRKPKEKKPPAKKKTKAKAVQEKEANEGTKQPRETEQSDTRSQVEKVVNMEVEGSDELALSPRIDDLEDQGSKQSLRITLKVNSGGQNVEPEKVDTGSSPERKGKRAKSRFIEPTDGFDDEISTIAPAEVKGRKEATKIIDSEDEIGELTPPPPSPPPKKESAKRKRTKSTLKAANTEVDGELVQDEAPKKRGRKSALNKAEIPAITPVGVCEEVKSLPPLQPAMSPPDSMPSKLGKERTSTTPAPQTEDSARKRVAHSPIRRDSKVPHRVGLSKRMRIEPLLKIVRK